MSCTWHRQAYDAIQWNKATSQRWCRKDWPTLASYPRCGWCERCSYRSSQCRSSAAPGPSSPDALHRCTTVDGWHNVHIRHLNQRGDDRNVEFTAHKNLFYIQPKSLLSMFYCATRPNRSFTGLARLSRMGFILTKEKAQRIQNWSKRSPGQE